jgi:hypothetical protein
MRRYSYGITLDELKEYLRIQNNACAICLKEFTAEPHVDHSHETGKVRGLLCFQCNTGIGKLEDNPINILQAALYLLRAA